MSEPLKEWLFDAFFNYLKLADNLYRIEGSCNSYLVVTKEGSVLIDPSGASIAPEYFERILEKHPLKAILLTHAHQDHSDDIAKWKNGKNIPVIAQREFKEYYNYQELLAGHFSRRNAVWSGQPIPEKPEIKPNSRYEPTVFFADFFDYELGGVHFKMIHTSGETPDQTTIWVPELEAVFIGDNYYEYFINNSTFRGTMIRPVSGYLKALDTALSFKPAYFLMGHQSPVVSKGIIQKNVGDFRDALKQIFNETIQGINEGKDMYTLMNEIKMPDQYPIGEYYGRVTWTVRGIYQEYIGWFDGNPASMYAVQPSSIYPELVELSGGPASIDKQIEVFLNSKDYLRALHLTDVVLSAEPDHKATWELRLKALQGLRQGPYNYIEFIFLDDAIRKAKKKIEIL